MKIRHGDKGIRVEWDMVLEREGLDLWFIQVHIRHDNETMVLCLLLE